MQVEHGARTEIVSDAETRATRAAEESDSTSVNANPVYVNAAEDSDSPSVKTVSNSVDASKQVGRPGGVGRGRRLKKGSDSRWVEGKGS